MFQAITTILKWAAIPCLMLVAVLSSLAGRYEGLLNLTICLSAVFLVQYAARLKNYAWAATFVVVVVVFSPLFLMTKIFLLVFLTGIAAVLTMFAAIRPQPVASL
jgi:hypothetical protein